MSNSRSPIKLRRARLEDTASIAELGRHTFQVTYSHSLTPDQLNEYLSGAYSAEATAKDIIDSEKDMMVATDSDGVIVGFGLLARDSDDPCIANMENLVLLQRLYVHPLHHGKGIGKILVRELESQGRQRGFKHVWLSVWEKNFKAQQVYERLGYRVVGKRGFSVGGIVQDDYTMVADL